MEKIIDKGFNYSGCYELNILFKSKNFYVMDNNARPQQKSIVLLERKNYIFLWIKSF